MMRRLAIAIVVAGAALAACSGGSGSAGDGAGAGADADAGAPGADDPGTGDDPGSSSSGDGAIGDPSRPDGGAASPDDAAATSSDPKTFITARDALLFADDFSSGSYTPNWDLIGGTWSVVNGQLVGSSMATEHDPNVGHMVAADRAVVQFRFSFTGTGEPGMRLNHKEATLANDQHRIALRITGTSVQLNEMSGWGSTSTSKPLATGTVHLAPNTAYVGVFEVYDRKVAFGIDGHLVVSATTSDQSATPKNHLVLAAYGASVSYDDVKVWAAVPP